MSEIWTPAFSSLLAGRHSDRDTGDWEPSVLYGEGDSEELSCSVEELLS